MGAGFLLRGWDVLELEVMVAHSVKILNDTVLPANS